MLELKLSKAPYKGACLIGYYTGTELDVENNIGLKDYSFLWSQNRVGFGGQSRVISYDTGGGHDPLTSADIVVGNISARYRDLVDPTPLFWRHRIGSNTAFGAIRKYIFSPTTDSISPTTANTMYAALFDLRKTVRLVEADGTESSVKWDLAFGDITVATNRRVAIGGSYGWDVYVYVSETSSKDRPLFVEFTSIDATGSVQYNHRELLNPTEYFNSNGIFATGAGVVGAEEYALEADIDNTYQLIANTEPDAMAIAFWSDDANWTWERNGADLEFDLSTVLQFAVTLTGKTVKEVVQEINAQNSPVKATLLMDYLDAAQLVSAGGPFVIGPNGTNPALFEEHYNVLYLHDTRFFADKPREIDNQDEWNPNIRIGHAKYEVTRGALAGAIITYSIPEFDWVTCRVGSDGNPFEYREPATVIRSDMIATRHNRLSMGTVIVEINGDNGMHLVEDYDAYSGIIKFSKPIEGLDGITVSYEHAHDGWYEIENLDLNPIQKHFQDSYRLFVGIYITPSEIDGTPSGPDPLTLKPVVGWVVGNTIAELESAVSGILDPTGAFEIEAKLIGIYQVTSQQGTIDVKVIDIRSHGGGVDIDVDLKKATEASPETQFYSDIGYWDGEPYPGTGIVIVSGPAEILGNTQAAPAAPSPNDGGFVDTTGMQNPSDIRRRLKKHASVGTYNVLDLE